MADQTPDPAGDRLRETFRNAGPSAFDGGEFRKVETPPQLPFVPRRTQETRGTLDYPRKLTDGADVIAAGITANIVVCVQNEDLTYTQAIAGFVNGLLVSLE